MSQPDVDAIGRELYALPPERFTAARDERAAEAKQAGDKDAAKRIAGLRRPTVAAWLVNLLALERPDLVDELLDLGEELRTAQHDLRGPRLRELSGQRRAVVDRLTAQTRELATAAGRPAKENLPLAEVTATLNAALSDGEVAQRVRAGRLVRPESYAGFGEVPPPDLQVVERPARTREKAPAPTPVAPRRRATDEAAQAARDRLAAAVAELADVEAEYERASTKLAELAERLARVQHDHAAARVELDRVALRRKRAQRSVTVATRAVPPTG